MISNHTFPAKFRASFLYIFFLIRPSTNVHFHNRKDIHDSHILLSTLSVFSNRSCVVAFQIYNFLHSLPKSDLARAGKICADLSYRNEATRDVF